MHHNIRAFDDCDPDATQALRDALPIVEELLAEKSKPEPRGLEPREAWLAYIGEIRSRLTGLADRAGCSVNELERIAEVEIKQRARRPIVQAPAFTAPVAPDVGFRELAHRSAMLERERAELLTEDQACIARRARIEGRVNAIGRELARIDRQLRRRGARGLA